MNLVLFPAKVGTVASERSRTRGTGFRGRTTLVLTVRHPCPLSWSRSDGFVRAQVFSLPGEQVAENLCRQPNWPGKQGDHQPRSPPFLSQMTHRESTATVAASNARGATMAPGTVPRTTLNQNRQIGSCPGFHLESGVLLDTDIESHRPRRLLSSELRDKG